jgi:hypothetical protein
MSKLRNALLLARQHKIVLICPSGNQMVCVLVYEFVIQSVPNLVPPIACNVNEMGHRERKYGISVITTLFPKTRVEPS